MDQIWLTSNGKSVAVTADRIAYPTISYKLGDTREFVYIYYTNNNLDRLGICYATHSDRFPNKELAGTSGLYIVYAIDINTVEYHSDFYSDIDCNAELKSLMEKLIEYLRRIHANRTQINNYDDQLLLDLFDESIKWVNRVHDMTRIHYTEFRLDISNVSFKKGKSANSN